MNETAQPSAAPAPPAPSLLLGVTLLSSMPGSKSLEHVAEAYEFNLPQAEYTAAEELAQAALPAVELLAKKFAKGQPEVLHPLARLLPSPGLTVTLLLTGCPPGHECLTSRAWHFQVPLASGMSYEDIGNLAGNLRKAARHLVFQHATDGFLW